MRKRESKRGQLQGLISRLLRSGLLPSKQCFMWHKAVTVAQNITLAQVCILWVSSQHEMLLGYWLYKDENDVSASVSSFQQGAKQLKSSQFSGIRIIWDMNTRSHKWKQSISLGKVRKGFTKVTSEWYFADGQTEKAWETEQKNRWEHRLRIENTPHVPPLLPHPLLLILGRLVWKVWHLSKGWKGSCA